MILLQISSLSCRHYCRCYHYCWWSIAAANCGDGCDDDDNDDDDDDDDVNHDGDTMSKSHQK